MVKTRCGGCDAEVKTRCGGSFAEVSLEGNPLNPVRRRGSDAVRREGRRGFPGVQTPRTAGTQRLRRGAERGAQRLPWSANPLYWWHAEVSTSPKKHYIILAAPSPVTPKRSNSVEESTGGRGTLRSFSKNPLTSAPQRFSNVTAPLYCWHAEVSTALQIAQYPPGGSQRHHAPKRSLLLSIIPRTNGRNPPFPKGGPDPAQRFPPFPK